MSRFHDEFFKKPDPEHDSLVLLTVEKFDDVFKEVWAKIMPSTQEVYVCSEEKLPPWCFAGASTAHKEGPICLSSISPYYEYYNVDDAARIKISKDSKVCSQIDLKKYDLKQISEFINSLQFFNSLQLGIEQSRSRPRTSSDDPALDIYRSADQLNMQIYVESDRLRRLRPNYQIVDGKAIYNILSSSHDYETEKICKSENGFIVGYADLVFDVKVEFVKDVEIRPGDWTWKKYEENTHHLRVVVECKPKLESFGGTLRQIKTYIDMLKVGGDNAASRWKTFGVVTTFSQVPESSVKFMAKEGVFAVTLQKREFQEEG